MSVAVYVNQCSVSQSMQCRLAIRQYNAGHSVQSLNAVYSQLTQCSQLIQCIVSQYNAGRSVQSLQCTISQKRAPYSQARQCIVHPANTAHHTVNKYRTSYSQSIQSIMVSQNRASYPVSQYRGSYSQPIQCAGGQSFDTV